MVGMANANAGLVFDFYTGATAGFGRQELKLEHVDDYKAAAQSYDAVVGVDIPVVRLEAEYNYLDGHNSIVSLLHSLWQVAGIRRFFANFAA